VSHPFFVVASAKSIYVRSIYGVYMNAEHIYVAADAMKSDRMAPSHPIANASLEKR